MMDNKLHIDFTRYEHNRYQHKLTGGNSAGNPKHTIKIQRMFCEGSFFFAPFAILVMGEFKTGRTLNTLNYLSLNPAVSGRIQDGVKLFASIEEQKLHRRK